MIPFIQSKVVVKDSTGKQVVNGNCYPTAIACILEMPPADVPNIENLWDVGTDYAYDVMHRWLYNKGFKLRDHAWEYCVFHMGSHKIKNTIIHDYLLSLKEDQKQHLRDKLKDKFYMVSGYSPRGIFHVCIYQNGVMVHDPHPTKEGIETEEIFEVIEKI